VYKDIFIQGIAITLKLNLMALVCGLPLALILFGGRTSDSRLVRSICAVLIETVKGIPALVIMFWLYLCLPLLFDIRLSSQFAAVSALALNYGVNASEVFRSAWSAVNPDLHSGLRLYGVPRSSSIAFFQAPVLIVATMPGLLAQLAATIKLSAVASFIGVPEVFHATQSAIQQTYRPVELYTGLAFFYLALVLMISGIERIVSRKYYRPSDLI
jgi:polar amino acid transport system permease protein